MVRTPGKSGYCDGRELALPEDSTGPESGLGSFLSAQLMIARFIGCNRFSLLLVLLGLGLRLGGFLRGLGSLALVTFKTIVRLACHTP